jgi:hypothetical protein
MIVHRNLIEQKLGCNQHNSQSTPKLLSLSLSPITTTLLCGPTLVKVLGLTLSFEGQPSKR